RLRWDNPWIPSEFHLAPRGGKYYMAALTMGGQTAEMPDDTVYWDLTAEEGQTWRNQIGTITVTSRRKTVQAMGQTYRDCIQIRETNKQGNQLFWTFARGVGFVQFGEGRGAFVLQNVSGGDREVGRRMEPSPRARGREPAPGPASRSGSVPIALAANIYANESFNERNVRTRFQQSVQAGISYLYLSPKWDELEPQKGSYRFNDLDNQIRQAASHDLPCVLNLRVVDTNQRAMPKDLMRKSFRDREVRDRLLGILDAILGRVQGRVQHMLVGNEVNAYFSQNRREVADYAELFEAAMRRIKERRPDMQVSVSIAFDGISQMDSLLRPLMDQTDFFGITYYPIGHDFVVRDPSTVRPDFARIVEASRGKRILLQEVGYPSSPTNRSSEDKQAQFVSGVLDELRAHGDLFIGAYFFLMSDLSDSVVEGLVAYYKLGNPERFRSFLKSLGMFDDRGRPKKSWDVFRSKAPSVSRG
ncbi:MAG: glycosyl hydrolase 53 family protein, partial [Gammaproteobacteria bacterium]